MPRGVKTSISMLAATVVVAVGLAGVAFAAKAPSPGTAKQVAALVAAAPKITTTPKDIVPAVSAAGADNAYLATPSLAACTTGATTLPTCVFGDTKGKHTMVLFGDSHAFMWFPAVDLIAKAEKWRLVALMSFGCPVADVTVWNVATDGPNTPCPAFRTAMIARINKLDPSLVIMSEGFYTLNADDQPITDAQWTTALETSLSQLDAKGMKKVLIGNTFLVPDPVACLAGYPKAVQTCSRAEDDSTQAAQRAAEQAATTEQGVPYINEIPWECSATCTVVIGNMIVYNSAGHISATYADYLSGVLKAAMKKEL